jgi:uncharacterized protein YbjT (DUF2867 family)
MKVILFGASGMVGQGALRECLLSSEVDAVLSIGRRAEAAAHPKLQQLAHADFTDFEPLASAVTGVDASLWCLGQSSAGMSEADYTRVTHDFVVAAAKVLLRQNPTMRFVFVSGGGTDSTETSRTMWARVKGKAENALRAMPFQAVHCFRPGIIQPLHGIRSRTSSYRIMYAVLAPLFPVLRLAAGNHVLTTERLGRALLRAGLHGAPKPILDPVDINALADAAQDD